MNRLPVISQPQEGEVNGSASVARQTATTNRLGRRSLATSSRGEAQRSWRMQGPATSWVRWGRAKDVLLSISCPLRKRFKSLVSARAFFQTKARSASYRQGASGCGVVSGVGNVTSCGLGQSLSLLLQLLPLRSSSPSLSFLCASPSSSFTHTNPTHSPQRCCSLPRP